MADEQFDRTESATQKRRDDFRKRGQVARSREISGVAVLVLTLLYFYFQGDTLLLLSRELFQHYLTAQAPRDFNLDNTTRQLWEMAHFLGRFLGLYLALLVGVVMLTNVAQTGWLFTLEPLKPDLERLNPISRFGQIFLSTRALTETIINLGKIAILCAVVYAVIDKHMPELAGLAGLTPVASSIYIMQVVMEILIKTAIFFVLVAIADYLKQWWELEKQMRMSKQEIRDEWKETEGNPLVKGQIRQRMRDITFNKMIQRVPKADVVVTNPTHFAVALQYEKGKDGAPRVVAKGQGFWAERIKAIARENGVEVVEDVFLARALYKAVKVGRAIPAELYKAVAELLAYVYALRDKRPAHYAPTPHPLVS